MALLGTYIDSRTLAALTTGASTSYAHSLGAAPDIIIVNENATTNSTTAIKLAWTADATNVTVYNHGQNATSTLNAVAIRAHSIIR